MVLQIDSDASYLYETRAHSRTEGHYYLSSKPAKPSKSPHLPPPETFPIYTECIKLRHIVASAAEAEFGRILHYGQTALPLRITLKEISFPLPQNPIKTDDSAAERIVTATVRKKSSKKMDMRFYCIKDRGKKGVCFYTGNWKAKT